MSLETVWKGHDPRSELKTYESNRIIRYDCPKSIIKAKTQSITGMKANSQTQKFCSSIMKMTLKRSLQSILILSEMRIKFTSYSIKMIFKTDMNHKVVFHQVNHFHQCHNRTFFRFQKFVRTVPNVDNIINHNVPIVLSKRQRESINVSTNQANE